MKKKKPLRRNFVYYLTILIAIFVGMTIYSLIRDGFFTENFWEFMRSAIYFPLIVTVLVIIYDMLTRKNREVMGEQKQQKAFIIHMSGKVRENTDFTQENFQALQENEAFQKAMHEAYMIFDQGETEQYNTYKLLERFEPESSENKAITLIVEELKEPNKQS